MTDNEDNDLLDILDDLGSDKDKWEVLQQDVERLQETQKKMAKVISTYIKSNTLSGAKRDEALKDLEKQMQELSLEIKLLKSKSNNINVSAKVDASKTEFDNPVDQVNINSGDGTQNT